MCMCIPGYMPKYVYVSKCICVCVCHVCISMSVYVFVCLGSLFCLLSNKYINKRVSEETHIYSLYHYGFLLWLFCACLLSLTMAFCSTGCRDSPMKQRKPASIAGPATQEMLNSHGIKDMLDGTASNDIQDMLDGLPAMA